MSYEIFLKTITSIFFYLIHNCYAFTLLLELELFLNLSPISLPINEFLLQMSTISTFFTLLK